MLFQGCLEISTVKHDQNTESEKYFFQVFGQYYKQILIANSIFHCENSICLV